MTVGRRHAVALAGAITLLVSGCGGDEGGVDVTLSDYQIAPSSSSAPAGDVTFNVTNDAGQVHEFVVVRTDLAEDQLPTDENGDVDESAEGMEVVDEIEDIEAGASPTLTVNLDADTYVLICNVTGHYRQGMHTTFTVE